MGKQGHLADDRVSFFQNFIFLFFVFVYRQLQYWKQDISNKDILKTLAYWLIWVTVEVRKNHHHQDSLEEYSPTVENEKLLCHIVNIIMLYFHF